MAIFFFSQLYEWLWSIPIISSSSIEQFFKTPAKSPESLNLELFHFLWATLARLFEQFIISVAQTPRDSRDGEEEKKTTNDKYSLTTKAVEEKKMSERAHNRKIMGQVNSDRNYAINKSLASAFFFYSTFFPPRCRLKSIYGYRFNLNLNLRCVLR